MLSLELGDPYWLSSFKPRGLGEKKQQRIRGLKTKEDFWYKAQRYRTLKLPKGQTSVVNVEGPMGKYKYSQVGSVGPRRPTADKNAEIRNNFRITIDSDYNMVY